MKARILNALLIISSLFGYLEWGQTNHLFLFQAEAEIITKIFSDPASILHPFTILPLLGQVLLLITLFQKKPGKILTYCGIGGIGILLALMFLIGCMELNFKILFSTVPFLVLAFITIRHHRKTKPAILLPGISGQLRSFVTLPKLPNRYLANHQRRLFLNVRCSWFRNWLSGHVPVQT